MHEFLPGIQLLSKLGEVSIVAPGVEIRGEVKLTHQELRSLQVGGTAVYPILLRHLHLNILLCSWLLQLHEMAKSYNISFSIFSLLPNIFSPIVSRVALLWRFLGFLIGLDV
jgi:hypothetical protein